MRRHLRNAGCARGGTLEKASIRSQQIECLGDRTLVLHFRFDPTATHACCSASAGMLTPIGSADAG